MTEDETREMLRKGLNSGHKAAILCKININKRWLMSFANGKIKWPDIPNEFKIRKFFFENPEYLETKTSYIINIREEIIKYEEIKEKLRDSVYSKAIYFFIDENGRHLYIGRASSIRNRLISHNKKFELEFYKVSYVRIEYYLCKENRCKEVDDLELQYIKHFKPILNVKSK